MGVYDHEPKANKGIYLRLKSKGEIATVRLASVPFREPVVWKEGVDRPIDEAEVGKLTPAQWAKIMREPDFEIREAYHWIVIDRLDGQVRIFSSTPMVYKAIKAYAQNPKWGDPTKYDFEITRTEEPGNYYQVTALPDKGELTPREQAQVDDLNIREKKPNAAPTDEPQIDDITEWLEQQGKPTADDPGVAVGSGGSERPGYDSAKAKAESLKNKEEEEQAAAEAHAEKEAAANPDPVITDIDDKPFNLDDIPF